MEIIFIIIHSKFSIMKNLIKTFCMLSAASGLIFGSCSNEEQFVNEQQQAETQVKTRTAGYEPKITVYIEVNDINPLNAGSYYLQNDNKPFFDYAIIFAANIRGTGTAATDMPLLYNNENVQAILNNHTKYIKPLQDKGIKVLYSILGDHTGLGVANLNDAQITAFATAVKDTLDKYNLDGVDIDDEWAEYGTRGYPSANNTSYGKLIDALRAQMPNKLITVFHIGYDSFTAAQAAKLDYGWYAYFGSGSYGSKPYGSTFPNSKWSAQAINLNAYNNLTTITTKSEDSYFDGMGAIMTYDLRATDASATLTAIAKGAYGSDKSVTHNGEFFSKDW